MLIKVSCVFSCNSSDKIKYHWHLFVNKFRRQEDALKISIVLQNRMLISSLPSNFMNSFLLKTKWGDAYNTNTEEGRQTAKSIRWVNFAEYPEKICEYQNVSLEKICYINSQIELSLIYYFRGNKIFPGNNKLLIVMV